MDNKTVYRLGQLYHCLEDAISPKDSDGEIIRRNETDFRMACIFPLKIMTTKIMIINKLHCTNPALERAIGSVYAGISLDDVLERFEQPLSVEQKNLFQQGYFSLNYKALATPIEGMADARKKAGLTIRGLAEITGLSTSTIQSIENGTKTPKIDTLKKIADACGVSVLEIWQEGKQ